MRIVNAGASTLLSTAYVSLDRRRCSFWSVFDSLNLTTKEFTKCEGTTKLPSVVDSSLTYHDVRGVP